MEAVTQGCAADTADHGVSRLYVGDALASQALHSGVEVQIMVQGSGDILSLARSRNPIVIRVLDIGVEVFKHVAQTGARPGAHSQINMVEIAHRVKPEHGRIDPAINRDVRRTLCGRLADGRCIAGIALCLLGALRRSRLLGRNWNGGHQDNPCQHSCALDNRSYGHMSVHVHTHHSYSPVPDSSMNVPP